MKDWLLSVFVIIAMITAIVSLITKFSEIINKPVRWSRERRQDHEIIVVAKRDIDALKKKEQADVAKSTKQREDVQKALNELKQLVLTDRTQRIRTEIINFSARLDDNVRQDQFKHVFNLYEEYQRLLEETGMVNGQTDVAMSVIEEVYKKRLKDGFR